jgi:hypothetical protein
VHPAIALMIIVVIVITVIPLAVWFAEKPFEVTSSGQVLLILAAVIAIGYGLIRLLNRSAKRPP